MKKIVTLALCMMLLVGLCFALASCQCKHEYGAEEKVLPTCTEDGKYVATCTKCGETVEYAPDTTEYDMKAKGHSEDEGTVITEPTCTTVGSMEIKCTECDTKIKDKEIPALGHDIDEDEFETDGTNHWNECSVCEAKQNETACTWEMVGLNDQQHGQSCSVCMNLKAGSEADHTLGTAVIETDSTCSVEGKQMQTCTVCEAEIESVIPTKSHTWGTTYKTDGTNHWYACEVCDAPNPASVVAHTLGEEKTYTPDAASCENGKKYKVCSVCENEVILEVIPSANPHTAIALTVVDNKATYTCSGCEYTWTASVTPYYSDGTDTDGWSAAGENSHFTGGLTTPTIVDGHYEYIMKQNTTKHQYQTWYRFGAVNPKTATQAVISVKLKPAAGGLPNGMDGVNLTDNQPTDRTAGYSFKLVEEYNGHPTRWAAEWCYTAEIFKVDGVGDIYGWVTETVEIEGVPTASAVKLGSLSDTEWTEITMIFTFDTENDLVVATYYINGAYAGVGTWENTTLNNGFESLYQNGYTNVEGTGMCIDDFIVAYAEVK